MVGVAAERMILAWRYQTQVARSIRTTLGQRLNVVNFFARAINAFGVQRPPRLLPLHLLWNFVAAQLLLILFLVRS